jgi:Ca2+-binding EF-hand superfamily protein
MLVKLGPGGAVKLPAPSHYHGALPRTPMKAAEMSAAAVRASLPAGAPPRAPGVPPPRAASPVPIAALDLETENRELLIGAFDPTPTAAQTPTHFLGSPKSAAAPPEAQGGLEPTAEVTEDPMYPVFQLYDRGGNGHLSEADVLAMMESMGHRTDVADARRTIARVGGRGGVVAFAHFVALWELLGARLSQQAAAPPPPPPPPSEDDAASEQRVAATPERAPPAGGATSPGSPGGAGIMIPDSWRNWDGAGTPEPKRPEPMGDDGGRRTSSSPAAAPSQPQVALFPAAARFGAQALVELEQRRTGSGGSAGSRGSGRSDRRRSESSRPGADADAVAEAFALLDRNGDGSLSRAEIIKGLRTQPTVRALLGLGATVRQEDGTRDAFEAVYQAIDRDGSKAIDLPEFRRYFGVPVAAGAAAPAKEDEEELLLVEEALLLADAQKLEEDLRLRVALRDLDQQELSGLALGSDDELDDLHAAELTAELERRTLMLSQDSEAEAAGEASPGIGLDSVGDSVVGSDEIPDAISPDHSGEISSQSRGDSGDAGPQATTPPPAPRPVTPEKSRRSRSAMPEEREEEPEPEHYAMSDSSSANSYASTEATEARSPDGRDASLRGSQRTRSQRSATESAVSDMVRARFNPTPKWLRLLSYLVVPATLPLLKSSQGGTPHGRAAGWKFGGAEGARCRADGGADADEAVDAQAARTRLGDGVAGGRGRGRQRRPEGRHHRAAARRAARRA